ncbi:MAG TPA: hypothetical protein VF427_05365 [Noviherbaspirillum sp.]
MKSYSIAIFTAAFAVSLFPSKSIHAEEMDKVENRGGGCPEGPPCPDTDIKEEKKKNNKEEAHPLPRGVNLGTAGNTDHKSDSSTRNQERKSKDVQGMPPPAKH